MTQPSSQQRPSNAPLNGHAPNADQLHGPSSPNGENPNAREPIEDKPQYRGRPQKYPAAKSGQSDPGGSKRKA